MLHNKYYEILKQFLGDYNKEVYGRKLIGKVKMSQKGIALALEELEKLNIIKSRKEGSLKYYYLNGKNTEIKDIIIITEIMRKQEFMSRERMIARLFKPDSRIVGIFGSYAQGYQRKSSDIDVFIIGENKGEGYGMGKGSGHGYGDGSGDGSGIMGFDISIKYFSRAEWKNLLKKRNNLVINILSSHILVFGFEKFVEMAWGNYYGNN